MVCKKQTNISKVELVWFFLPHRHYVLFYFLYIYVNSTLLWERNKTKELRYGREDMHQEWNWTAFFAYIYLFFLILWTRTWSRRLIKESSKREVIGGDPHVWYDDYLELSMSFGAAVFYSRVDRRSRFLLCVKRAMWRRPQQAKYVISIVIMLLLLLLFFLSLFKWRKYPSTLFCFSSSLFFGAYGNGCIPAVQCNFFRGSVLFVIGL